MSHDPMTRTRLPRLPLRVIEEDEGGIVLDGLGETLVSAEVAGLNRAAYAYRTERPKLRRALREAIDNLRGYMGGPRDMDENELGLLLRLHAALGARELAKFKRDWNTERKKR